VTALLQYLDLRNMVLFIQLIFTEATALFVLMVLYNRKIPNEQFDGVKLLSTVGIFLSVILLYHACSAPWLVFIKLDYHYSIILLNTVSTL